MATVVHQLSSSDEDSVDSFPDIGTQVESVEKQRYEAMDVAEKQECEAVDLTLSSDTEDVVEMIQEESQESISPPVCKAPWLSEDPLEAPHPSDEDLCAAPCLSKEAPFLSEEAPCLSEELLAEPCTSDEDLFPTPRYSEEEPQHHDVGLPQYTGHQTVKKPRRATSKEEREAAKQQREEAKRQRQEAKQQREAEKRQRALEKEASQAKREEERSVRRAQKPGECLKLLVVELERRLVEAAEGGRVLSQLQEAGVACRVVDGQVAASVTFFRADPISGKETKAEEAVVVMKTEDFVSAIGQQIHGWPGGGGLCHTCRQWQTTLGTPHLSLAVCGVEEYLRKQKTEKQQQVRSAVLGGGRQCGTSSRQITRLDIETALVAAQMECRVNHRLLPDGGKVALYMLQVAKAVAEAPYKREKGEALFSWYADGSCSNSVRVDRNSVGLYKLWQQQLRQFSHLGVEVAQAVATRYPSPQALVQAYKRCGSQREAEHLLEGLRVRRGVGPLASDKRIGKEFSRKIHLFLTSRDPNQPLGHS